ncbi:glutaredoxin family protein [Paenibacillus sp. HN-1]|uniref:glutaredoxin family protein n=1 Tax=Paenibacillus TaxID=44249 RepID=UPI001CA9ECA4|nr:MULTISPECIES: glutaredoxin family protein [Paenibacillus]MBY9081150.1 glutaredoxin family protein [Paenibacillus sp. CGMCC 1.18879]MBY9087187.1 glutaredoxin family protein [Paenibacillus sinensis]
MSAPVIVYSTEGCSDCSRVKQMLKNEGVPFEVRDILASETYQQEVESFGFMGIPVTVAAGRAVKGFNPDELKELLAAAGLEK